MRCYFRFSGIVVVAVLLSLAIWLIEQVSEVWTLRDQYGNPISLSREYQRSHQMDQRLARALNRIDAKRNIVWDVLAGELTLLEAATGFARADATSLDNSDCLAAFAGASEEEKRCRCVIEWVVATAADERSAGEAARLRKQLEAELQEHLDRDGMVKLPSEESWGEKD